MSEEQFHVYEILATLTTKISKMKVGKIKNLIDRGRLKLHKKWFGSSHFKGILNLRAQFVDPMLKMAPSKSLKLMSSCPKIDFRAKLS
jgi:hypothetical protein